MVVGVRITHEGEGVYTVTPMVRGVKTGDKPKFRQRQRGADLSSLLVEFSRVILQQLSTEG